MSYDPPLGRSALANLSTPPRSAVTPCLAAGPLGNIARPRGRQVRAASSPSTPYRAIYPRNALSNALMITYRSTPEQPFHASVKVTPRISRRYSDFSCSDTKIVAIYVEAVRDSASLDHLRAHHNFLVLHLLNQTRVAQYTYRSIQVVLRLYSPPGEVLAGFDIDTCCLYDGKSHDIQIREPCLCKPTLHSLPHVSGQHG